MGIGSFLVPDTLPECLRGAAAWYVCLSTLARASRICASVTLARLHAAGHC